MGQLQSGGLTRDYRVHVSASALPGVPAPVVLNFHGRGGNAERQETYSGFIPVSDREGFLLVTPNGTGNPRGWGAGASLPGWPADDVAFVSDLLTALQREFCVDAARIYAAGFSNGAFMAARLGCVMSDRVVAVAAIAGAHYPSDNCGRPVPFLAFHGTADTIVPFGAGKVREVLSYPGARAELAAWAKHNRCIGSLAVKRESARVERDSYAGCAADTALVAVDGVEHTWPGAPDSGCSAELSAAETAWGFFAGKRLGEGTSSTSFLTIKRSPPPADQH